MKIKYLTIIILFSSLIVKGQDMALPSNGPTYFSNAGGDAATWSSHNIRLNGWYGMGLYNPTTGGPYANQVTGVIDFRSGYIKMRGGLAVGTDIPLSNLDIRGDGGPNGVASFFKTGGVYTSHILYGGNGDWYIRSAKSIGTVIIQDQGGNVGIGTSTPDANIQLNVIAASNKHGIYAKAGGTGQWSAIFQNSSGTNEVDISSGTYGLIVKSGNVGIGTTQPQFPLHISNNSAIGLVIENTVGAGSYNNQLAFRSNNTYRWQLGTDVALGGTTGNFEFYSSTAGSSKFVITPNGTIGIGISTPPSEFKLAVAGKILAEEVQVSASGTAPWPDFVFTPTYKLRTLPELEQFINENKHLPDVPSKEHVAEQGISLGEMNAILLQKIEELTLYTIEQEKDNEKLEDRIEKLEAIISQVKK